MKIQGSHLFAIATAWLISGNSALAIPATETATSNHSSKTEPQFTGMADYYHHSLYGRKTASGQTLQKHLFTAAHRTLPFGTHVHVKNHSNGRSCVVVINDRGPYTKSKVIDLSHSAAEELGMISAGTCKVGCSVVPKPKHPLVSDEKPVKMASSQTPQPKVKQDTIKTASVSKAEAETASIVSAKPAAQKIAVKVVEKVQETAPVAAADEVADEPNEQAVIWSKD